MVIAIAALAIGASAPYTQKMYYSMQYQGAVKDTLVLLHSARQQSLASGGPVDLVIDPQLRQLSLGQELRRLPQHLQLSAVSAAEVNRADQAVIRFYPDGSSSGGTVTIRDGDTRASDLQVNWFLGKITQHGYVPE